MDILKNEEGKLLSFQELKKSDIVIDEDGDIGFITECSDIHNIKVEFNDGQSIFYGIYCLDKECEDDK